MAPRSALIMVLLGPLTGCGERADSAADEHGSSGAAGQSAQPDGLATADTTAQSGGASSMASQGGSSGVGTNPAPEASGNDEAMAPSTSSETLPDSTSSEPGSDAADVVPPTTSGTSEGTDDDAAGSGGGTAPLDACEVTVDSAEISAAIATVGIVTFSTDATSVASARIEFGLEGSFEMIAPVDLDEPDYRTLLLGMKQSRVYTYRVVVETADGECTSDEHSIETESLPNVLSVLEVDNIEPEKLQGGFVSTGQYQARGGETSPAYVIDKDGDYVWALQVGDYVTGVRQSYDGKYMWINGTDNTTNGEANIHRVTMDGLVDEDMSEVFGQQDHSITVLPDETVVFYGHDETRCANIRQRFANGDIEAIINSGDAHGASGACHVNAIEYSPMDDTLIFSDDNHNNYTKITRDGEVVWVLGGETSDFTGDASQWIREHGIDVIDVDRVLIFNNNEPQDPRGSLATEIQLDLEAMTATKVWEYQADPPISNQVLGDVQRLANGNTVIAYSAQGLMHEVDAEGNLLQEIVWPLGAAFGYIVKRDSLYGPPPR